MPLLTHAGGSQRSLATGAEARPVSCLWPSVRPVVARRAWRPGFGRNDVLRCGGIKPYVCYAFLQARKVSVQQEIVERRRLAI
jgi:hypothetical protein